MLYLGIRKLRKTIKIKVMKKSEIKEVKEILMNEVDCKFTVKGITEYDSEKDIVIYSCDSDLIEYGTLGFYENEGQIELHIDEGIKL